MTASADKVQFILQSSLEQTLPLVKKGIFSQQQLRQVMIEREKHQNKLYSSTYKLSHYLKAIQFEYDLQRQRLYRIKNQQDENINPMFRKQGKTDFSVVRRIIKLWDRTMHKYRFRTYLWKQYLSFCIIIKSKKHFYKALTNALRFLPFELQLWKIGVRYQVEVGRNLWKARKLFHKGLKLVHSGQKSIQLTKQLIKFELQFVETLQSRQKIIQGQDEQGQNDMKFIIGDNNNNNANEQNDNNESSQQQNNDTFLPNQQSELLKLRQYHEILFVALVDSITKNYKSKTYFRNRQDLSAQQRCERLCDLYLRFLTQLKENEENQLIEHILTVTIKKLGQYKDQLGGVKLEEKYQEEEQMDAEQQQDGQQQQRQIGNKSSNIIDNNDVLIQQQQPSQHQLMIQQQQNLPQPIPQQQLTKQQQLANDIFQTYNQTNKFNQKKFTKAIKQLCLKPLQLSAFLEKLIPHFLAQCLDVLKKNEWLRIPLKSLQMVLKRVNVLGQEEQKMSNINMTLLTPYMLRQFQKINPIEYMSHSNLLKQVITFNRKLNKIEENNKLFRSILVNCKQNIEFIQRAKGLFVSE